MKHEVSYVFADGYDTVRCVVTRMAMLGYDYRYQEMQMTDGTIHRFCIEDVRWLELPNMEAVLKWLCADIHRLKDAYDDGILCMELTDAE